MAVTGPCWYCYGPVEDVLEFSYEFDTYVHLSCLKEQVDRDSTDREAAIMARELGVE